MALVVAALAAPAGTTALSWPPFLPGPSTFAPGIVAAVERLWSEPTFARTVEGEPAAVPLAAYLRFVDAPDLTAAAARHLGLARYDVSVLDTDWYRADDREGAQGVYRVLRRDGGRRVVLSWGTHRGKVLGTIDGSALSVLEFEDRDGRTGQRLTAYVLIDNRLAAALARVLVPLFGGIVDRKLAAGFRVTAGVAEWAAAQPADFCHWLAEAPLPPERQAELAEAFAECRAPLALTLRDR